MNVIRTLFRHEDEIQELRQELKDLKARSPW